MKTWNTPEVNTLAVSATANGIIDTDFETLVLFNDSHKKPSTPVVKPEENNKPETKIS